jgi:uncharacterized membrane protein
VTLVAIACSVARAADHADPEAVRLALEHAFARTKPESHALRDFLMQKLGNVLEWLKNALGLGHGVFGSAFSWLVLAAIVIALVVLAVRVLPFVRRDRSSATDAGDASDARERRVAELRRRAGEAEAGGDHAQALRLYFWALVVGLGERGALEYRDAWTNRELLERGAPRAEVERVLRPLVPELDRKTFGRVPADADDVRRLSELCDEMLGRAA